MLMHCAKLVLQYEARELAMLIMVFICSGARQIRAGGSHFSVVSGHRD